MPILRNTLLALGLSAAASSAFAETVYTFAYSNSPGYDTKYVSASVKSLESTKWEIDAPALRTRWHDVLRANGYSHIDSYLSKKGSTGNYYSSYDEAEIERRAMSNGTQKVLVNW